ncbi:MAG: ATP-dependent DNA helicase RecG [Oscillospiraceae bacterium]|nr:ATP-dependent DNA helicase RecG [Oscillospiraceae bacterium]
MLKLDMPITAIPKIGEKRAALYRKLGIETVSDLINHFPRSYIDFTQAAPIDGCHIGDTVTVAARVLEKFSPLKVRGKMTIFRLIALDSSQNAITVTFFNNKYAFSALKSGEEYIFHGKLSGTLLRPELSVPLYVPKSLAHTMQPHYPLTAGLSHKMIAGNIRTALDLLGKIPCTALPPHILETEGFENNLTAFEDIHFPKKISAANEARRLFILEELLCLQLGMAGMRRKSRHSSSAVIGNTDLTPFLSSLPFSPTAAQSKAIATAISDMQSGKCMNRLLQGDVGSGKTLVAAALFYAVCRNGGQCAFMAPTEILATQHFKTLSRQLEPFKIRVALLTGSTAVKDKKSILEATASGDIQILCGTHALIEKSVEFNNLALVITDEQHRFGVSQRASLISKGSYPHTLIMSATPIPRSLALTIYGDLDISVLDELPAGRKAVKTYLIDSAKRLRAFGFLEKEIQGGRQVYIVCPAVEESELEIESAIEYHSKVCKQFKGCKIGLLHGRMKGSEKDAVMAEFRDGKIDILVSTTVIEVGVDVANASVIMIENADRFGLSQLHQLRGRVGRGSAQAHCILISDSNSENAKARLSIMTKTNDGLEIAKFDLEHRGPGDFFGDRQHGLPPLKTADLISDSFALEKAQKYAAEILKEDCELKSEKYALLKARVNSLFKKLGHTRSN